MKRISFARWVAGALVSLAATTVAAGGFDVLSSYCWRDGVGYYQSTKDTATHYYFDRLNKGVFVLETSYRVQQRGTFSGGLATIQCMYAPEFTAHSAAETVRVK